MFDVPDAKRVRRDELYGSESEEEGQGHGHEDSAIRAKFDERLSHMFELDFKQAQFSDPVADKEQIEESKLVGQPQDEPAFEFRLFSTAGSAPRIAIPENEDEGDGGVIASRPMSFYLKREFSPDELQRFEEVAVSYSDIIKGAQQRAWGLEVPWRVTKFTLTSGTNTARSKPMSNSKQVKEPGKRTRPGKKRRIALRIKEKERKKNEEDSLKLKKSKEEHLREKKKRLNREKKLKRRQKEKEKKMASKGGVVEDTEDGGDDGSASSGSGDGQ